MTLRRKCPRLPASAGQRAARTSRGRRRSRARLKPAKSHRRGSSAKEPRRCASTHHLFVDLASPQRTRKVEVSGRIRTGSRSPRPWCSKSSSRPQGCRRGPASRPPGSVATNAWTSFSSGSSAKRRAKESASEAWLRFSVGLLDARASARCASALTLPAPLRDQGRRFLPGLPHENAGCSSLDLNQHSHRQRPVRPATRSIKDLGVDLGRRRPATQRALGLPLHAANPCATY